MPKLLRDGFYEDSEKAVGYRQERKHLADSRQPIADSHSSHFDHEPITEDILELFLHDWLFFRMSLFPNRPAEFIMGDSPLLAAPDNCRHD